MIYYLLSQTQRWIRKKLFWLKFSPKILSDIYFLSLRPPPLYCPGPSCSSEYLCWRGLRRARIIFSSCSWWYFYNHLYDLQYADIHYCHWDKPELSILPTVDDEVDGTVEDYEEVGDSHGHLRLLFSSECIQCIHLVIIIIGVTDNQYYIVFRRVKKKFPYLPP